MIKAMYWIGGFMLLLSACSTPEIAIDKELEETAVLMPVKGRQGWLVNQKLSFGDYQSGKVDRSWKKSYDLPFILRFSGSKEKLRFDLRHENGRSVEVFCLGKLKETDLPLMNAYFEVGLKSKDHFAGTVVVDNGQSSYDFLVSNLNQNNWFKEATGYIHGKNHDVEILPLNKLASGQTMLSEHVPGFSFQLNGRTVGAVETLNQGRIWIKKDLSEEMKLVLAAVSSALLLRSDLEKEIS